MTTLDNDCDSDALTYSCVCENNVAPNITQYSQTLPYYICTQWGTNCVKNCNGDNTCADKCRYVLLHLISLGSTANTVSVRNIPAVLKTHTVATHPSLRPHPSAPQPPAHKQPSPSPASAVLRQLALVWVAPVLRQAPSCPARA